MQNWIICAYSTTELAIYHLVLKIRAVLNRGVFNWAVLNGGVFNRAALNRGVLIGLLT